MHINAQGGGHCLDVQPEGREQLQEAHLLAGQGIREGGAGVVALRPAAAFQQTGGALLRHPWHPLTSLGLCAGRGVVGGSSFLGLLRFQGDAQGLLLLHVGLHVLLLRLASALALLLPLLRCQLLPASLLALLVARVGLGAVVVFLIFLLLPALLLSTPLLASLALLLTQALPLLALLLAEVVVPPLVFRSSHIVLLLLLFLLPLALMALVSLAVRVGGLRRTGHCRGCLRGSLDLLVVPSAARGVLPAAQSRGQGYVVYFDVDPVPFGQHRMANTAWREHGTHIVQRGTEGFAHFVDVVPLVAGHRSSHIIGTHLGFVEEPLEHK